MDYNDRIDRMTTMVPLAPTRDPGTVQSLVRAFQLLELIAASPAGMRLGELSRMTGLHKSTAFRMLRTMAKLGYVAQGEGKLYCIGERRPAGGL
jgi:IclR family acetate operon transcriptional repressor